MLVFPASWSPETRTSVHHSSSSRGPFLLLMGVLIALAWLTLWMWEQSPYGRYIDHGSWNDIQLSRHDGHGHFNDSVVLAASLYVGGWILMTAAMMLPTTIPLLEIFRRLTRRRRDTGRLVGLVIGGYLSAWLFFGLAAHALDWGVIELVRRSEWLGLNAWVLGSIVLAIAGVFQFTDLKYRCLDQCRAPLSFVLRHWGGGDARRQAIAIGIHHGIYCIGCCWALMLLMFIVGTGSVGWMFLLAAVMAAEKNLPNGRLIAKPLGFALTAGAAILVIHNQTVL